MSPFPASGSETVHVFDDMQFNSAPYAGIVEISVALDAQLFLKSNFGTDLDPFLDYPWVICRKPADLAENLQSLVVTALVGKPAR